MTPPFLKSRPLLVSPHHRAFTLIELLIVITILGILSTLGLSTFRTSQIKARDAERKSDLKQIQNAVELVYNDYGRYPLSDADGNVLACEYLPSDPDGSGTCSWGDPTQSMTDGADRTTYLKTLPQDPAAFFYFYQTNSTGSMYRVLARLENAEDPSLNNNLTPVCDPSGNRCNFGLSSANTNITTDL